MLARRTTNAKGLKVACEVVEYTGTVKREGWDELPARRLLSDLDDAEWWEKRNSAALMMHGLPPPLVSAAWDFFHKHMPLKRADTLMTYHKGQAKPSLEPMTEN